MTDISVSLAGEEDWLAIARQCEYATFFHTPLWHRIAVETFAGYRDASLRFEINNGVTAVLPLIVTGTRMRGLCTRLQSTFAGCYGGIIADGPLGPLDPEHILHAVRRQCAFDTIHLLTNPLLHESPELDSFAASGDYFTQWIGLAEGYEAIFARFGKSNKKMVRRAQRNGIATRVATSLDEYRIAYDAYRECQSRWGENTTNDYPWRLFETVYAIERQYPENIRLWLAEWEGQVICTGLVFYWNQHAVIWFSSSYANHFSLGGNNALRADIIKDACSRGYKYFDFNPSGGHQGVVEFKDSFGATMQPIKRCTLAGFGARSLGRLARITSGVKRALRG